MAGPLATVHEYFNILSFKVLLFNTLDELTFSNQINFIECVDPKVKGSAYMRTQKRGSQCKQK